MIKTNYDYSNVKLADLMQYEKKIIDIVKKFEKGDALGGNFIGWYQYPLNISSEFIADIYKDAEKIKKTSDVLVVCGIGGSYLGSRAVIEALRGFKNDFEIIYMGNTFDEKYLSDCLSYLRNKDFSVNVISKSGSTLETAISFRLLKELLKEKYGEDFNKRIYATTDCREGLLLEISKKNNYKVYDIPKNIGGRYSVFTAVGLLPLAVAGVDINQFIKGAKQAYVHIQTKKMEENIAYQYAAYRYHQYMNGKQVELFATYSPYLNMVAEWWKQLYGESEGKEQKGLFPASVTFSTDLHSLGQYIQQGTKCLFLTQLKIQGNGTIKINKLLDDEDNLNYLGDFRLNEINEKAQEGTNIAHYAIGKVDHFTFYLGELDEKSLGYLLYIYMYSCMISANLLGVNPFDQPGVEYYKKEMKKILKK